MLTKERLPFLKDLQMRYPSLAHNAGWYDSAGVRLGWGDLNLEDFRNIQKALLPGEMLVVVSERALWDLDKWEEPRGWLDWLFRRPKSRPTVDNLGRNYLAANTRWLITAGEIYLAERYCTKSGKDYKRLSSKSVAPMLQRGV